MSIDNILREYGQAFRGDWSSNAIDGRSVRDEMADIANWIAQDSYPGDDAARDRLGICPAGEGHWSWLYCDDNCTTPAADHPTPTPNEHAEQARKALAKESA